MPFPLDKKYIEEAQLELDKKLPESYIAKMLEENGGELITEDEDWQQFPVFDKADDKRISRTCNHIILETNNAKTWGTFPENAVAIASNGCGDYLILLPNSTNQKQLQDNIFIWRHETGDIEEVANDIYELME